MSDKIIYKITIIGNEANNNIEKSITELIMSINWNKLALKLSDFIFKENNLMSETIKRQNAITIGIKIKIESKFKKAKLSAFKIIWIKETKKIAFAGVGSPKKSTDCRVSLLNFANRQAEKTGINTPIYGKYSLLLKPINL